MTSCSILYVSSVPFVGGAELTQLNVLSACKRQGYDLTAVVPAVGDLSKHLAALGVRAAVARDPLGSLSASRYRTGIAAWARAPALVIPSRALVKEISRHRGVVYCGGLRAQARATLVSRLLGRPVAWHVHEHYEPAPARAMRMLARLPNLVLTVSQSVAGQAALDSATCVQPILNGVPDSYFELDRAPRGADTVAIGTIGHLTPLKGHDLFLRLIQRVQGLGEPVDAVILGGSPYLTTIHSGYARSVSERAASLGVVSRAVAPEEIPGELARLDVVVHLSHRPEGFGRVLAEAQAAALPVVAYAWGGAPEIVVHGETGILVDPGDFEAAVAATVRLIRDRDLRECFGRNARANASPRLRERRAGDQAAAALAALC